ncbi:phosphocarrier protein [Pseudorhodobacter antarcticus]|uniref:Phosphocarrier protein n=1 Tax=Pseudorhodobacter antarcticus TaxID=1077947 RepID=A0A1H8IYD3_9RHOB|nr:HPr family phosphocarrier protein [Pseudorhodobacter antarcticus]SEN73195.1 phosphocarrier protein [Pseudorhodobacter antarcticus]
MTERVLKIVNEKGLHARASAKFVEVVEAFDGTAEVTKDGMSVSGDSIMGLLMLAASRGTSISVKTSGSQSEPLMDALETLVKNLFGEDF